MTASGITRPSGRVWIETIQKLRQRPRKRVPRITRPSGRVWIETCTRV